MDAVTNQVGSVGFDDPKGKKAAKSKVEVRGQNH